MEFLSSCEDLRQGREPEGRGQLEVGEAYGPLHPSLFLPSSGVLAKAGPSIFLSPRTAAEAGGRFRLCKGWGWGRHLSKDLTTESQRVLSWLYH